MPQLVSKPLPWFKTNPEVRKSLDEAELLRLGESLKAKQLQPVFCQPDGTMKRLAFARGHGVYATRNDSMNPGVARDGLAVRGMDHDR